MLLPMTGIPGAEREKAPRDLRIHVLGEVRVDGLDRAALGSRKARQLLRELALARGGPVSADSLADTLWHDDLPRDPAAQVAVLVSRLRAAIGADRISHGDAGYALHYQWLDLEAAEQLTDEAERRLSRERYAAALSASRGALALLRPGSPADGAADSLALRLTARARRLCARALLASADHSGAVEVAQQALDADPLDEEALRLAMAGMAAGSRTSSALALHEAFRERLLDELGVSPSWETDIVHRAILKGEPVPGIVVGSRNLPAGRPEQEAPLAGRDVEYAALNDCWRAARTRGITRVGVDGEPGIGKTFLVRAWIAALPPGTLVLEARCDEVNPSLPLQPILDAVHARLRELGSDEAAALLGPERRLLAPLLGTPFETAEAGFDVALSLASSPAGTAMLNTALISVVRRLCANPSVLFIDDAHRIDQASASWLAQLASRSPDLHLLVITTQRTTERRLLAVDRVIDVGPLSLDAAALIVGAERAPGLYSRTGGNALFLTELAGADPAVTIPESIQASIAARCEGAPDIADTLRAAAVLGLTVDVDLLARVLRADPIRVIDHLEQGTRLALLEERQATFVFRHEIVREAMVASAGALRRAWLHREAALCLEGSADADPLMVAEHARLSGERHIAARALARASSVASSRFDHDAARSLVDDSLAFEETTDALLQRARLNLWQGRYAEAETDAEAALARGDDARALEVAGAIAYYRRRFDRSSALAQELRDRATDQHLQLGGLIIGARAAHAAGDMSTALTLIEGATRLAHRSGLAVPNSVYAVIEVHRGAVQHAVQLLQVPAGSAAGETSSTAYTSVHEHFIGGYSLATCGRVAEALERWERADTEAHRQGFVRYMTLGTNFTSWVYRGIGEHERAREGNREAVEGGRATDYRELEAFAILDLCETDVIEGDIEHASRVLGEALVITSTDYAYRWRHLLRIGVLEARIALARDDAERARATAVETCRRARAHSAPRYELLSQLVELEATAMLTGSVDRERLMRVCRDLPGLAGPDAWWLVGHAASATGVDACAALAQDLTAQLATALPGDLRPSFERYARTRLDRMSTSGRSG